MKGSEERRGPIGKVAIEDSAKKRMDLKTVGKRKHGREPQLKKKKRANDFPLNEGAV